MGNWIIFIFLYAIFNGLYRCTKKKTLEKNSIYESLAFTSLISFILVSFISKDAFSITPPYLLLILGKSIIVVIAWLLGTYALSKMPVSLYGILNLSRITFTLILSIIFLGENITPITFLGMIIVMLGIILVNKVSNTKEQKETTTIAIIAMLIFCLLSSA